jgi:alpha-tubulin suppressor-like RCC1 family protein
VRVAGTLHCWGSNAAAQLGDGTLLGHAAPVPIEGDDWLSVETGRVMGCGIRAPGTLWCWGDNARGQLGDGTRVDPNVPTQVGMDTDWTSVTAGFHHTCAFKAGDSSMWCWGDNSEGQLGANTGWRTDAVQVP